MKKFICLLAVIGCILCASKKTNKQNNPVRSEIRGKMIECISKEAISDTLKEHLEKVKNSDERIPLHFTKVELDEKDREIIKECKRAIFKERRKKKEAEMNATL